MKRGLFLQVRLDSVRLPRKALLPVTGVPLIVRVMRQLKKIKADIYCIVTDASSVLELEPLALAEGFDLFVGPKDDVLKRFALAIDVYQPDIVIRATGDNPLVNPAIAEETVRRLEKSGGDYCLAQGIPIGSGIEAVRAQAVQKGNQETNDPYNREHVCPYFYRNPHLFQIDYFKPYHHHPKNESIAKLRFTVDTFEDYHHISALFEKLLQLGKNPEEIEPSVVLETAFSLLENGVSNG